MQRYWFTSTEPFTQLYIFLFENIESNNYCITTMSLLSALLVLTRLK